MTGDPELVVIGAGPAGIGAAISAGTQGVDTLIVDEASCAGGQVYRALPSSFKTRDGAGLGPDHTIGDTLRDELKASPVRTAFATRIWSVTSEFRIDAIAEDGSKCWRPKSIVAATGTYERVIPFPGWTCPGVIGLGAATILLKSQQILPGNATVVAGVGPLVAAVAAGVVKGGGKVAAMIDLAGPADWLSAVPAMVSRPDLLFRGLGWLRVIRASGVPILFRHAVIEVKGEEGIREVVVGPVDATGRRRPEAKIRTFKADTLAIGHGLIPSTEITQLLHADHEFQIKRGGLVPVRDSDFRSSVEGLYVAGDGGGIFGAAAALLQGRIAGLTAARDLGKFDVLKYRRATAKLRKDLGRAEKFGGAMARMMALQPDILESVTPETVVCRCEDVTRAQIEDAIGQGAVDVNQLKSWTRCGMGSCQGRMCGQTAATLAAARLGNHEAAGQWTRRTPLRPAVIGQLIGEFEPENIEIIMGQRVQGDDQNEPLDFD